MISYQNIKQVHLEVSSRCNASCPECPRNLHGVDGIVDDYPVCDMTIAQAKQIFSVDFLKQLNKILINGNYGDFMTCRDGLEIVEYFRESNPDLEIRISTNASARPKIWERLAELKVKVLFRIDGLEDTHHLYRQGTSFAMIMENAEKFISAGGWAEWIMINFDFNKPQRDQALMLSIKKGFKNFEIVDGGRNNSVAFTPKGEYSHTIGDPDQPKELYFYYSAYKAEKISDKLEIYKQQEHKPIYCYAKSVGEIYISANGDVTPCCWTGFFPLTNKRMPGNDQLAKILVNYNHNALEVGLEQAIKWFADLEKTWKIQDVHMGRSHICNSQCGNTVRELPPPAPL